MKFFVGDPSNGPFAKLTETDESAARIEAARYGEILDEMDWEDDDGKPAVMFIVGE